jgi:hypothetical protein
VATLDNLDQDTYRELIAAIVAHEEREDAALTAKKNGRTTASPSLAI